MTRISQPICSVNIHEVYCHTFLKIRLYRWCRYHLKLRIRKLSILNAGVILESIHFEKKLLLYFDGLLNVRKFSRNNRQEEIKWVSIEDCTISLLRVIEITLNLTLIYPIMVLFQFCQGNSISGIHLRWSRSWWSHNPFDKNYTSQCWASRAIWSLRGFHSGEKNSWPLPLYSKHVYQYFLPRP